MNTITYNKKTYMINNEERYERAKQIPDTNIENIHIAIKIQSETNTNEHYIVMYENQEWKCTCGDYTYRQIPCKHILKTITNLNKTLIKTYIKAVQTDPKNKKEAHISLKKGN